MLLTLVIVSTLLVPARPAAPVEPGAGIAAVAGGLQAPAGDDAARRIISLAARSLYSEYPRQAYRFSLKPRWIPGSLLRHDPSDIKSVELKGRVDTYTNFVVTYRDRRFMRKAEIQLALEIRQKLPVAVRRLNQGYKLKDRDVALRWVEVIPGAESWVQDEQALTGMVLRSSLRPGEPIRKAEVGGQYIVRAGESVKLLFEKRGLQVQITAEARQNGAKNEEITIYSKETRRKYVGRVIAPGEVTWIKTL